MGNMIETKNIHKSFPIGNKESIEVLKGIDMQVPQGKLTILKARSGSGKTTLVHMLIIGFPTSKQTKMNWSSIICKS